MNFEFATATRIIFGAGKLTEVAPAAKAMGRHALVVTGRSVQRADPLLALLQNQGVNATPFCIGGEPKISDIERGVTCARDNRCEFVIGLGGGSIIDAGKAISALLTNLGRPLDYLEVIGRGQALREPPAPFIAIPTTAGTGAEVTRNAVLSSPRDRLKVSLRHPLMLPRLAIVDPELTYGLPPALTAATGLDALTQLIEPLTSRRANPMTDALCRAAIPRAARSLQRACQSPDNQAREDMAFASLHGGLALANSGLGAVHGFASPLGGMFPAPHGAVCAALLPYVMTANEKAMRHREPNNPALERYTEIACLLSGRPDSQPCDGIDWVKSLVQEVNIPGLNEYGISTRDFPAIIERARNASSMKANPIILTANELSWILEAAL